MSDITSKFHIIASPVTVDIQALTHTYTVCRCVYNQSSYQNCTRLIQADVSVTVFRRRLKSIFAWLPLFMQHPLPKPKMHIFIITTRIQNSGFKAGGFSNKPASRVRTFAMFLLTAVGRLARSGSVQRFVGPEPFWGSPGRL
jgi:hypothetical protein